MKILYTSEQIHTAIKRVLSNPQPGDLRVVLVAYVGDDAEAFLPDAKSLRVICSLTPVGTSAAALDNLKRRGAVIQKSARLHMKVYWSSRNGCVIGSANASKNALGLSGLKEASVLLPPGKVDVERLIREAQPGRISDDDLRLLTKKSQHLWVRTNGRLGSKGSSKSFLDWYASPARIGWRLGWWEENAPMSAVAKKKSKEMFGKSEPNDFLQFAERQIVPGDWLLQFRLPKASALSWMYTDFTIAVPKTDKAYNKDWPREAITVHSTSHYPTPPFRINDVTFRRAFQRAVKEFGAKRIMDRNTLLPPQRLLDAITQNLSR